MTVDDLKQELNLGKLRAGMIRVIIMIILSVVIIDPVSSLEKLDDRYCVGYGNPDAQIQVTEYFSLSCPTCQSLFVNDFEELRERYLDTGRVYWVFHPVPIDLTTIQAMECLAELSSHQKRVFLEALIAEMDFEQAGTGTLLIRKAMDFFGKAMPPLDDLNVLRESAAFKDAFRFVNQEDSPAEMPTVEINGVVYPDLPDMKFLRRVLDRGDV